jgi:exonuclease III
MSANKFSQRGPGTNARRGAPGPCQTRRRANDHRNGPWGDKLGSKTDNIFRYCFANIYGLPISVHHEKHDRITNAIKKHEMDVLGLAEINLNFPQLGPNQQWIHRFPKLQTNSHYSTNKHTTSTAHKLYGGTAYITNQATSPKVSKSGADPTGLGRWTWVKLTGRQGLEIRIINGYRPVRDTSNRAGTVYSQHKKYFMENEEYWDPRLAFLDDLEEEIKRWQAEGNLIILGVDLNDNTWTSPEAQRIEQWGLKNALKHQHPTLPPSRHATKTPPINPSTVYGARTA